MADENDKPKRGYFSGRSLERQGNRRSDPVIIGGDSHKRKTDDDKRQDTGFDRFVKTLLAAVIGGPLIGLISVPVVRMLYNVPYDLAGDTLSDYNAQAARMIGYVFVAGLVVVPLLFRRRSWVFLIILALVCMLMFLVASEFYRSTA